MKSAAFDFYQPSTLTDACKFLSDHQGDCRVLAGGQTLIPTLAMRMASPGSLVDLSLIDGLQAIRYANGELIVGAMVRQSGLERALKHQAHQPVLSAVLPWVAHPPIRNRGTVCGSLAHADPSAELALALLTLEGRVLVQSTRGQRFVSAKDLFVGTLQTSLEPDEIIVQAHFPMLDSSAAVGFSEFGYRHGDFAVASVLLVRDPRGVRLGFGGVDDVPLAFDMTDAFHPAAVKERILELARDLDVRSDPNTSSEFRRHLLCSLGDQAIAQAWA